MAHYYVQPTHSSPCLCHPALSGTNLAIRANLCRPALSGTNLCHPALSGTIRASDQSSTRSDAAQRGLPGRPVCQPAGARASPPPVRATGARDAQVCTRGGISGQELYGIRCEPVYCSAIPQTPHAYPSCARRRAVCFPWKVMWESPTRLGGDACFFRVTEGKGYSPGSPDPGMQGGVNRLERRSLSAGGSAHSDCSSS